MLNPIQTRFAAPRHAQSPDLVGEPRTDKGPKNLAFDAIYLGVGRRAQERALKLDRKR
jgi:hypothetical protein